jgi:hypothetical protein
LVLISSTVSAERAQIVAGTFLATSDATVEPQDPPPRIAARIRILARHFLFVVTVREGGPPTPF